MSNYKIQYGGKKKDTRLFHKQPVEKIQYESEIPNIEKDAKKELTELESSFRKKLQDTDKVKNSENNTEYWSCVVFENQEQRDRFYEILGVRSEDNQYISGKRLIKGLEMAIETGVIKKPKKFNVNKDILDISIKPNFLT